MPVILPVDYADEWLKPVNSDSDRQVIKGLIKPFDEAKLDSYMVRSLRGENAAGNVPEANQRYP